MTKAGRTGRWLLGGGAAVAIGVGVWWLATRSGPVAAPSAGADAVGADASAGVDDGASAGVDGGASAMTATAAGDAGDAGGGGAATVEVEAGREGTCERVAPLDCGAARGAAAVGAGGIVVTQAALCEAIAARVGGGADAGAAEVVKKEGAALLERMLDAALVKKALREAGTEVTAAEVDAALAKVAAPIEDEATRVPVRAQLAERLERERLVAERGEVEPSADEVKAELDADPGRFGARASVTAQAFLARPADDAAKRRATAWRTALDGGASAAAPSEGVSALGEATFVQDGLEPELEAAVWGAGAAADGGWLGPIATKSGWLVLRVTGRTAVTKPRLEDVYEQARVAASQRLAAREGERIVGELRGKAGLARCVTFE